LNAGVVNQGACAITPSNMVKFDLPLFISVSLSFARLSLRLRAFAVKG
jgi:hypothetical protein